MTITYPDARELHTIGRACEVAVYLDPATRTLCAHEGDGVPMPTWLGRHVIVCDVPHDSDGESVLAALRACEAEISALADCYVDGHWVGRYLVRDLELDRALCDAFLPVEDGGHLRQARDAAD